MNPKSIKILSYIDANGGRVPVSDLNQVVEGGARIYASLCIGRLPNCVKDGSFVQITERGLTTLRESGVTPNQTIAPIIKRELQHSTTLSPGTSSIINIRIDRNSDVKVYCQVSPKFSQFLNSSGHRKNVISEKTSTFARNWDCNSTTDFIDIDLKELDRNFSSSTNIISEYGINPFIIKLAAANGGSWTVNYKGLVSKEKLIQYATQLRDSAKSFYYSYIKPVKIEITLNVVE